jgi:hypothetical protein
MTWALPPSANVPVRRSRTVALELLPATARAWPDDKSMSAFTSSTPQTLQLVDHGDAVWLLHCQSEPWARAPAIRVKKVRAVVISCIGQVNGTQPCITDLCTSRCGRVLPADAKRGNNSVSGMQVLMQVPLSHRFSQTVQTQFVPPCYWKLRGASTDGKDESLLCGLNCKALQVLKGKNSSWIGAW